MNALKAINNSVLPRNPTFRRATTTTPPFSGRRNSTLCGFCSSDGSGSGSLPPPSEGDKRRQEILARIAMLQAQKVRLTDFLDERSAYLTQFAEEANVELDQIGEDALRELDEASARIMENLDGRMQAFEETAEANRQEIEKNEKILEEFEEKIERDRNEGLFFKNLREKKPQRQDAETEEARRRAKMEAGKLKELAKEKAGSKGRRNVYLALMGVLVATMANAVLASPAVEWKKVAALGFLLLALLAQYIYELQLSSPSGGAEGPDEK